MPPSSEQPEGPRAWRTLGRAAVSRGGSTGVLVCTPQQAVLICTQWVLWGWAHLRGICHSLYDAAPSPLMGRLRVGAEAQKAQGKSKILRYLPPQNLLEKSGKSLHISSAVTTEFPVPVKILKKVSTTTQHSVTLLRSSQVISISLTTGVQVSTLNLLLKHFEINIPTFHVLKEVHSLCQKSVLFIGQNVFLSQVTKAYEKHLSSWEAFNSYTHFASKLKGKTSNKKMPSILDQHVIVPEKMTI